MLIDYLEEAINIPQRTMHLSILCSCFLSFLGCRAVNNLLNQTVENKWDFGPLSVGDLFCQLLEVTEQSDHNSESNLQIPL